MNIVGYTRSINFYQKVDGLGWVFQSFRTTEDDVRMHLRSLIQRKRAGTVRLIDTIKLR
jgi:hypothetical protein